MIYAYPEYYNEFACIAGECRHSCCIGWEIDIDPDTAEKYRGMSGELGEKIKSNINWNTEPAQFMLGEGDRCRFLNKDGLCEIILRLGEKALCQICTDHPRYRSFMSERCETGLGLCCEAAAELILKRNQSFFMREEGSGEYTPDEDAIMDIRDAAFELIDDRKDDIIHRTEMLLRLCGSDMPNTDAEKLAGLLLPLERLDEKWTEHLNRLKASSLSGNELDDYIRANEQASRNILNYFVFRYFPAALDDGDIAGKAAFAVLSMKIIMSLACVGVDDITECARMYSSEIEYSEDNLYAIWDVL